MSNAAELFGSMVFSDRVMKARLPETTYQELQECILTGNNLQPGTANVIAGAMKDWALEKDATHYCHWFQPMTGFTAEKQNSFVTPQDDGSAIMEFSGKELIRGEPDASSFPSGGLRATFEARGYTAWDPTSFAFIKDGVLCIPTAFCSFGGEALDKKTPLLRSMQAINTQALRILRLFGNNAATCVRPTAGAEQEYFLVDRKLFEKRRDLIYTGRTLLGARPPKGQEIGCHYFGAIKPRIAAFMRDLNDELWKVGVLAKTQHNEAAPAQYELAPVFMTVNIAADQNQLVMETMRKTADKHGMVCLLHEKPFSGVNGSGKHNNWSLSTDTGENLLEPGDTPAENAQFLTFLCAVLKAVDDYQDLLRVSVASAENDLRLGVSEAPPAILSVYLGEELTAILGAIEQDAVYHPEVKKQFKFGVFALPRFPKDSNDRNRTSPFAFTGNKFEFRMVGSSASISGVNTILNTIVAEELRRFADRLEQAENFDGELHALIREVIRENKRIIFNGNGYGAAWEEEAARRGLLNLPATPDCAPYYISDKNIQLFTRHKVFSETELRARYEILLQSYCQVVSIEAKTMIAMAWEEVFPAVSAFSGKLASDAAAKQAFLGGASCAYETDTVSLLTELLDSAHNIVSDLSAALETAHAKQTIEERSRYLLEAVLPLTRELRGAIDAMERLTDRSFWPYPSYGELLFNED